MRKTLLFLVLVFALIQGQAQSINQIITDPDIDREILIGEINEEGLENPIFVEDWQNKYDIYLPDKVIAKKLKKFFKKNKDITIKVFLASWCGDSQEHLPDFVKLLDKIKFKNVKYYALDRQKSMNVYDFIDLSQFNIERVPTFIIYKGEEEIGRIIETPKASLERDLWEILSNK